MKKKINKVKCAFLDRDGVLNKNINGGYVGYRKNFKWTSGAKNTIKFLNKKNYKVIVVTNQSGIARGYFSKNDVLKLHNYMSKQLNKMGAKIDKFFICPHHVDGKIKKYKIKCECRKPGTLNFKKAKKIWDIDPKKSFMVGDQLTDMQFAKKSRIRGLFFEEKNLYKFIRKKIFE